MAKSPKAKLDEVLFGSSKLSPGLESIAELEESEFWDIMDDSDQAFWEEFFQIEDLLSVTDDLTPISFTISVQNNHTGEVRTFRDVHLCSVRKKILC